jgi:hypothetical protein
MGNGRNRRERRAAWWRTAAPDALGVAALLALAAFHLRDPLAGRLPVSEDHDTLLLQYPLHEALDDALADGELPWWVPEAGNGLPLAAEGEAGALFPPNLVLFGMLPPYEAYVLSLLLALAALGIGAYGFARSLGAGPVGSFLAGAALMLSGFSLGHERHLSLLRTAALLPWLLWVAEAHARRPRLLTVGLGALVVALQWLAGNPQLAHLSALTLALYLPVRAATEAQRGGRGRLLAAGRGLGGAAAMVGLGLLVAAVQLLPSWLYVRETARSGGLSLDEATHLGFPPRDLLLFIDPDAFGTPFGGGFREAAGERSLWWENVAYVGLLPLVLAPAAVVFRSTRRAAVLLAGLAVLGIAIALGRHLPVFRILRAVVPGLDGFRVPQRWLLVAALGLAALAALGLTELHRRLAGRWNPRGALAVAVLAAVLAAYDVARFGDRYYPTVERSDVEHPSPTAVATRGEPVLAVREPGEPVAPSELRTGGWFGRDALALVSHSLNVAWHVRSPLSYVGLPTRRAQRFEERIKDELAATYDADGVCRPGAAWVAAVGAAGARWVASFVPLDAPDLPEAFAAEVRGFRDRLHVYRNLLARPRASLVERVRRVPDEAAALDALFSATAPEPSREAIVETSSPAGAAAAEPVRPGRAAAIGSARLVVEGRTRIAIDVDAAREAWLVTTDVTLAGWSAAVDGRPAAILPADCVARAVRVPAGRHRVVMEYAPPGRTTGWVLGGLGLASLLGVFAFAAFRSPRRRGSPR